MDERKIAGQLEDRVRRVVAERVGVDAELLVPDLLLADELALDSLDVTEVVLDLESVFRIRVPDRQVRKLRTFGDVLHTVRVLVAQRGESVAREVAAPAALVRLEVRGHEGHIVFARATHLSGYGIETLVEDVRQIARRNPVEVVVLDDPTGTAVATLQQAFELRREGGTTVHVRTEADLPVPPLRSSEERSRAIVRKADWPRLAMAIVSNAGELLDALQRERLFAAAHLSAMHGHFEPDLEQQQARSHDVREGARALVRAAYPGLGDVVEATWKRAFARLLEVEAMRSHVTHRQLGLPEALEAYGQACAALLECAGVVPASLADSVLARSAIAMHEWLCTKEELSAERAQLVGTFVGGTIPPSDPSALAWLTESLKGLDGMKAIEDGQMAMGLERANRVVSLESASVALAH
jgi:acyl carrier protein